MDVIIMEETENQVTKLLEKYHHLKNEKAQIIEILIESEINGHEKGSQLFMKRLIGK